MKPFVSEDLPASGILSFNKGLKNAETDACTSSFEEWGITKEVCPPVLSYLQSNPGEAVESKSHNSQAGQLQPKRTLESFSLEGRVCVVTGGASGIGLEICRAVLASGCKVAIVDANGKLALGGLRARLTISRIGRAAKQQADILTSSYQSLDGEERLVPTHS